MSQSDSPVRVVAWIRRTYPVLGTIDPFALLELEPVDDSAEVTAAFERIADSRHPDHFRGRLGRVETAQLEAVFAACVAAHHRLLDPEERRRLGARPRRLPRGSSAPPPMMTAASPHTKPAQPPGYATPDIGHRLSPRALHHARQARAALDTGDVASAILYLRMAIAAEPSAQELRLLLADAQARLHR
jgi:hypothetical protein